MVIFIPFNILAIALPSLRISPLLLIRISPLLLIRIATIALLYAVALSFNVVNIQSIGSGKGIFSGLFHVTLISQSIETFFYILVALIFTHWSQKKFHFKFLFCIIVFLALPKSIPGL
nr:hypothetical protein [Rhizoctonia sp.]